MGRYEPDPYKLGSLPPQENRFLCPSFSQYNTRLLRPKAVRACMCMPQDGHWLASSQF